jgi:hypothetical protein
MFSAGKWSEQRAVATLGHNRSRLPFPYLRRVMLRRLVFLMVRSNLGETQSIGVSDPERLGNLGHPELFIQAEPATRPHLV